MTNAIWKTGIDGDWATGADWTGGLPTAGKNAIINASGTYTVTVSSADVAHSLTLDQAGATLSEDSGGSLTMAGGLTLDAGTVILDGANSFGAATQLFGGTLELNSSAALGASGLSMHGGALIGTANMTFSDTVAADGSFTMAAAHGDAVKFTSQMTLDMNDGGIIQFGQAGDDGIFVWAPLTLGVAQVSSGFSVDLNAGTLRDGNGSLGEILHTSAVDIEAGAELDTHGYSETFGSLSGGGDITTSKTLAGMLTVGGGDFSGTIGGDFGLAVNANLLLAGVNTYTGGTNVADGVTLDLEGAGSIKGGTTLGNGATLDFAGGGSITGGVTLGNNTTFDFSGNGSVTGGITLGNNAAFDFTGGGSVTGGVTIGNGTTFLWAGGGSIGGSIVDDGTLDIQRSDSTLFALHNGISGTGSLDLGNGVFASSGTNTYGGGTTLNGSQLQLGSAAALGAGGLIVSDGTLVGTATEAVSNQLSINGKAATFLADHGTTLTLNTGAAWTIGPTFFASLVFGDSTHSGVVVWDTPAGSVDIGSNIEVAGGTLRAGDSNFQTFLNEGSVQIDEGGKLDVAGFAETIRGVTGKGTIENTGAATTLTLVGCSFSGKIAGPITLDISGNYDSTLRGAAANYGTINVVSSARLILKGPSSANIVFASDASPKTLSIGDFSKFTGTVAGFDEHDWLGFGVFGGGIQSVSYSGNTSGGVLSVTGKLGTAHVTMIGDYTHGSFVASRDAVSFVPSSSAVASAHADTFHFSATPVIHAAPEAGVTHLHGGHSVNEFVIAHDVIETLHAHDLLLDQFAHGLFAHGHAFAEALA